jgi:hypothetical protein
MTIFFLISFSNLKAEELLKKKGGDAEYLGWRLNDNTFITCKNEIISFGPPDWNCEKTEDKCPQNHSPRYCIIGTITNITLDNVVILEEPDGKQRKLYYPDIKLSGINIGKKVEACIPIEGRAESMKLVQ